LVLSQCFKNGTIDSHQAAEDVQFLKNFICGKIDRELYKQLLAHLYYVYETLEERLLVDNRDKLEQVDALKIINRSCDSSNVSPAQGLLIICAYNSSYPSTKSYK
jgi:heme oxygenase